MKFAVINDIHLGPPDSGYYKGVQRKLTRQAGTILDSIISELNNIHSPEFVINLGDSIEDVNDRAIDILYFNKVRERLLTLEPTLYWLIGNHDIRTLGEDEIAELLSVQKMYYSFDRSNYHFVVLSFEMTGDHKNNLNDIYAVLPEDQIEWLKEDLASTDKETVIFVHYGVAEDDMIGNFWFEGAPDLATLGNRAQIRSILERSGNVRAVISAHQHWNRMHIHNDIPYFTVTSMIENFNNDGIAAEAFTLVELDEKKIIVDVRGNDPALYEYIRGSYS